MHLLNLFPLILSLFTTVYALSGDMTWYSDLTDTNLGAGHCSYSTYTIPSGLYGMAIPYGLYDNSSTCGACAIVHYGGKSIETIVIDSCGGCPQTSSDTDLFPDGFSQLADLGAGRITQGVSWDWVDCNHEGNIWFHVMEGSSVAWFAVQAVNHNWAITSLQVSTDGGSTFADMDRRPDGFFLARGTLALSGGSTVAIKAWAGSQSVVATGVAIGGGSFEAAGNFA